MKPSMSLDQVRFVSQDTATLTEHLIEIVEGLKILVGQRLVSQGPEPLGRLDFWRIGRQEHQLDPFWYLQVLGDVPARLVEYQNDVLVGAGADLPGKRCEKGAEGRGIDAIADKPDHLSGCRADETIEIEPLEPVMAVGDRTAAPWGPDSPDDRLQPKPMLVKGPDFNRYRRFRAHELGNPGLEFFLKASCS